MATTTTTASANYYQVACNSLPSRLRMQSTIHSQRSRVKTLQMRSLGAWSELRISTRSGVGVLRMIRKRRTSRPGVITRASAYAGKGSVVTEEHAYDLYELLGLEAEARLPEIKQAYRWLQKRCHPDIAGEVGHDMAILLNDAYATLSDPMLRAAYDAMRAERAEFDDFTGEPIYSKWLGPREENRAIFVNEVECIGCLKCALIASNTFAIENKYGRARAVGQWGDSESTINDAIQSCPVDCISLVEREKLAALEFIMSKQPRVLVGIDMHSYGGQRTENVFATTDKFLRKCAEREKLKRSNLQETARQREARMAAAEGIQARAGWWWHHFIGKSQFGDMSSWNPESARASTGAIIPLSWVTLPDSDKPSGFQYKSHTSPSIPEELGPLLEAAAQRRQKGSSAPRINSKANAFEDEYWSPAEPLSCPLPSTSFTKTKPMMDNGRNPQSNGNPRQTWIPYDHVDNMVAGWLRSILAVAPLVASVTAAVLVGMTSGMDAAISSEVPHAAGPLPAEFTSSVIVQMFLAAAVWYAVGTAVSSLTLVLAMFFVTMKRQKEN